MLWDLLERSTALQAVRAPSAVPGNTHNSYTQIQCRGDRHKWLIFCLLCFFCVLCLCLLFRLLRLLLCLLLCFSCLCICALPLWSSPLLMLLLGSISL